ncbi:M28 family peptidase [Porphyromonas somerae]
MNRFLILTMAVVGLVLSASSCDKSGKKSGQSEQTKVTRELPPSPFVAEKAYAHIAQQLAFGPRVPNTEAHRATANYIVGELEQLGLEVKRQEMSLTAYDGTKLECVNIIGSYQPERERRIMLFAHWDTRPFADNDPNPKMREVPILGADDGASGPGVMLELARLLASEGLENYGVDLMFFDAEDYGLPAWETQYQVNSEYTWALGTQYWTKNLHKEGYKAEFGILLDMVGAKNAVFKRESLSQESAGQLVTKIWKVAEELGHGTYFQNKMGGAITDDHCFVIRNLRIPCVDIINYDEDFGDYWHTHNDNLDIISKETLQAVGETVWQVLMDYDHDAQ